MRTYSPAAIAIAAKLSTEQFSGVESPLVLEIVEATLATDNVCHVCGGRGRVLVQINPTSDPQDAYDETDDCSACDASGRSDRVDVWIPIAERKPHSAGTYIAALEHGMVLPLRYSGEYWTGGITRDLKHPTHWMPLPAAPAVSP